MKIQTIILICIIVIYRGVKGSGKSKGGRLSENENKERLETCGKEFLPTPSENQVGEVFDYYENPSWLLWVRLNNTNNVFFHKSAAFPISKRYVLTSVQVVISESKRWTNGKEIDHKACETNKYLDLPQNVVDSLHVVSGNQSDVKVLRGRAYADCGARDFHEMFGTLLLEVEELPSTTSKNLPCLADDSVPKKVNTVVHAYGLDNTIMKHHKLVILYHKADEFVYTTPYTVANDRGGPLVLNYSSKATVIGMKTSIPNGKEGNNLYFVSMMHMSAKICEYSGVCQPPPPSTTTTTTEAPTSPEPSTTTHDPSKTTNPKISTTKSPESPTKAPKHSRLPGNPTQKPEKGRDSEEETDDSSDGFEGDVEYVDEEDEVGVPLFFGIDEWNGSGRSGMELNFIVVLFLVIILGV